MKMLLFVSLRKRFVGSRSTDQKVRKLDKKTDKKEQNIWSIGLQMGQKDKRLDKIDLYADKMDIRNSW